MKTQSIKSIATLGVAVVLNVSALAGPGPQPQFRARNVSTQQSVSAASSKAPKATIAFGGTRSSAALSNVSESRENPYVFSTEGRVSAPSVTAVPGPHGVHYVYRW